MNNYIIGGGSLEKEADLCKNQHYSKNTW